MFKSASTVRVVSDITSLIQHVLHVRVKSHTITLAISLVVTSFHQPFCLQLVELKNGVTFNGHLVDCDHFMNVTLREVYQTSADGEKFWKMKEMFIKGNVVSTAMRPTVNRVGGVIVVVPDSSWSLWGLPADSSDQVLPHCGLSA